MEIKKLYSDASSGRPELERAGRDGARHGRGGAVGGESRGADTVSISSLSRDLSSVSDIVASDEMSHSARLAELKKRVQHGTYSVDSKSVAESLISYAKDAGPAPVEQ